MFLLGFPLYKITTKGKWRHQRKTVLLEDGFSKIRKSIHIFLPFKSKSRRPVDRVGSIDSVLYNLPNIERDILNDGIVEQGTLGGHFTHVRRRNETRHDEVMPDLGGKGQMFSLKVDGVALTIEFPLAPAIIQHPNDLGVVGVLIKPIKQLRGDMGKTIIDID